MAILQVRIDMLTGHASMLSDAATTIRSTPQPGRVDADAVGPHVAAALAEASASWDACIDGLADQAAAAGAFLAEQADGWARIDATFSQVPWL